MSLALAKVTLAMSRGVPCLAKVTLAMSRGVPRSERGTPLLRARNTPVQSQETSNKEVAYMYTCIYVAMAVVMESVGPD